MNYGDVARSIVGLGSAARRKGRAAQPCFLAIPVPR